MERSRSISPQQTDPTMPFLRISKADCASLCSFVLFAVSSSSWCPPLVRTRRGRFLHCLWIEPKNTSSLAQPFGRKDYWQSVYKQSNADFSWYAGWLDEMKPFVEEWVMEPTASILIPGIGNDAALLRDMYAAGYRHLSAFDYAEESVVYLSKQLPELPIDLCTADARNLSCYRTSSFDAVIDKGTLDAVFLAGNSTEERQGNLKRAVAELQRVLKNDGVFISLSGICVEVLQKDSYWPSDDWDCLTNGSSLYTTETGYTSNNLDGTLMVWKKKI